MPEKRGQDHRGGSSRRFTAAEPEKSRGSSDRGGKRASSRRRSLTGNPDRTTGPEEPSERSSPWQEPRGVQKDIADADKVSRTGSKEEPVRNTPPAGAWNDTSRD